MGCRFNLWYTTVRRVWILQLISAPSGEHCNQVSELRSSQQPKQWREGKECHVSIVPFFRLTLDASQQSTLFPIVILCKACNSFLKSIIFWNNCTIYTHVYTHIHIYIHICIYVYMHICHIHTHIKPMLTGPPRCRKAEKSCTALVTNANVIKCKKKYYFKIK